MLPLLSHSWREFPCFHAYLPGLSFFFFLFGADFFSSASGGSYHELVEMCYCAISRAGLEAVGVVHEHNFGN